MGCLRSLTGATAGAERSAPTTTSLSPASSCKASHSPSAKVRTPPRSLSSSGGATQPRAAVLPCWRDGCGASCDANCDASCDASESGAVAKRSAQAQRMAKGAQREGGGTSSGQSGGGSGERAAIAVSREPSCPLFFSRDLSSARRAGSSEAAVCALAGEEDAACDSAAVCAMLCRRLHGPGFASPHCCGLAVVAARHLQ